MYYQENRICSFCVNDYHLAVMLVPYIYEAVNEGKKVITFFDRDLTEISSKVIITNKTFWEHADILEKVDWKKVKFDKLSQKLENMKDEDVLIVGGKEDFIERLNRLLINFHINFTIVNCFYISDIAKNENFKISDYTKILNTKGLEEIQKCDFV